MLVSSVVHPGRNRRESCQESGKHKASYDYEVDQAGIHHEITSFPGLEPDVLESVCRSPVELRGCMVIAATRSEVPLGDPG